MNFADMLSNCAPAAVSSGFKALWSESNASALNSGAALISSAWLLSTNGWPVAAQAHVASTRLAIDSRGRMCIAPF